MYKLLLVTDREEVKNAFLNITDWNDMTFHPITIISDIQEAISYLETNPVDAVGCSVRYADAAPLHQYLVEVRPSLPIFQTHQHDDTLRVELRRIRGFLDHLRGDHSDSEYSEEAVLEYLRDELIHQLLARSIDSREELKSRLKLVRSGIAQNSPCLLFDFDMPQGELYLTDRWHYGSERLENALRSNFFGRYVDGIYYGVAVLTQRHVRLIAFQPENAPLEDVEDVEALALRVHQRVQKVVADIKEYLDLDLNVEQFTVLDNMYTLVSE